MSGYTKMVVHVAVGFSTKRSEEAAGLWPLRPICGGRMSGFAIFYKGHQSLAPDNAEPCVKCFEHPDMPLILLGAI